MTTKASGLGLIRIDEPGRVRNDGGEEAELEYDTVKVT